MSLIPRRRLALLLLVPAGLALIDVLEPGTLRLALAFDLVVALAALVDGWMTLREPPLRARREAPSVVALAHPALIRVEVESRAERTLEIELTDDVDVPVEVEGLPVAFKLPKRGVATLEWRFIAKRRGRVHLGDHHLRFASPLGLWSRQICVKAQDEVRVLPDINAVSAFELMARRDRDLASLRVARPRGGQSEFESLREYRPDDEFRHIDWRATARRGSLVVREHKIEENQQIVFALDAGRLMTATVDGLSFYDHALNSALLLSHVAARGGDRVGALSFAERPMVWCPPRAGKSTTRRIVDALFDQHPRLVEPELISALRHLSTRLRKRSLVVLYTQVVDDHSAETLLKGVATLNRHHLVLCVLFQDEEVRRLAWPTRRAPSDLTLLHHAAAAEQLLWRGQLLRRLQADGAQIIDVSPGQLTPALLSRYLEIKTRHLL
ncbi:DUF58 domain-containing protein [Myxococcota bacterium]|nr:DUF58 domain-containing protein [Myxococcota bacterium]MBU1897037.1 DUF58 domain-containing protein [Myxococcota bacterium]